MTTTFMKTLKQPESNLQNAIPGVFALLSETQRIILAERSRIAGYTAWLIMPALALFAVSFFPLGKVWTIIFENVVLVVDILLSLWVGGSLLLLGLSSFRKESLSDEDISRTILRAFPTLLYLYAFTFFSTVLGLYLFIIPGVLAYIWFLFSDIICLHSSGASFRSSLLASKALSQGRFLSVFFRVFGGYGVIGIAYALFSSIVLALGFSFSGIDPLSLISDSFTLTAPPPQWVNLLLVATSLPFIPYFTLYSVALYDALKKA